MIIGEDRRRERILTERMDKTSLNPSWSSVIVLSIALSLSEFLLRSETTWDWVMSVCKPPFTSITGTLNG